MAVAPATAIFYRSQQLSSGLRFCACTVQLSLQFFDLLQQATKLPAEIGEPIFDPRRNLGILNPLKDSGAREMTEAVGQNLRTDAFDVPFKRARPLNPPGHRA